MDSIPDFAKKRLNDLRNAAAPVINKTLRTILELKEFDVSDYKPSAAKRLKAEILVTPRKELHEQLRTHISAAEQSKQNIRDKIRSHSSHKKSEDPLDRIDQNFRDREIRDLIRAEPDPQRRKEMVQDDIRNGNGDYIRAVSAAPDRDRLLPGDSLWDLQRQLAFKQDPQLLTFEYQVNETCRLIRKEAGRINGEIIETLMAEGLEDPLPKSEHFQTFVPVNNREKRLSDELILREMRKQSLEDGKEHFTQTHQGIGI